MTFLTTAVRPVLALLALAVTSSATGKPSAPEGLLVNDVPNPLAIERDAVRFTWKLTGKTRGEIQTAYQILVASSAERLARGEADYWDRARILDAIEKAGKPDIGGYGGDAFYSGVLNAGGGEFVVRDLGRYRPMLEANQANWESFGPGGGEANHAWTAYPGYLFQKYICGIQPTSGGFATFDVRPETGGLNFAEGTVPTVKGDITTRWEKGDGGQFSLSVRVPPNTRAAIYLPKLAKGRFTLTESGKRLWPDASGVRVPGVLEVQEQDSCVRCVVGAGDYRFHQTPAN